MNKIILTQRTNRHVVKRVDSTVSPATYDNIYFGTYLSYGSTNSALNFPNKLAFDAVNNIYICDTNNSRIVKLTYDFSFISSYSTLSTVGKPFAILSDANNDLYIVGVKTNTVNVSSIRIQRLTTSFVSVKVSGDLHITDQAKDAIFIPKCICRSFTADSFYIGGSDFGLFETTESLTFSNLAIQTISGIDTFWPNLYTNVTFNGIIKHANGNLYVNNGRLIFKINSSLEYVSDSGIISKTIFALKIGSDSSSMLIYNVYNEKLVRYDENLNFIEDVYIGSQVKPYDSINVDAYDIVDFYEIEV